jgi:hypothetical protein
MNCPSMRYFVPRKLLQIHRNVMLTDRPQLHRANKCRYDSHDVRLLEKRAQVAKQRLRAVQADLLVEELRAEIGSQGSRSSAFSLNQQQQQQSTAASSAQYPLQIFGRANVFGHVRLDATNDVNAFDESAPLTI